MGFQPKYSEEVRAGIKTELHSGILSREDIALKYGVSKSLVDKIAQGSVKCTAALEIIADPHDYERSECRTGKELRGLWERFSGTHKLTYDEWILERDKCRKDLFYLGRDILGKDWLEAPHRLFCSYFVQKNFDGTYHEDYLLADVHAAIDRQQREKEMLLLAPRGSYKSTVDGVDCVQWLLNCPDMRILIITGEFTLGQAFLYEIKQYFTMRKGQTPTKFHRLFPEYIIDEKAGNSDQPLKTPARKIVSQKEPSLWVNSITANLSGWHCDLMKGDDVVTDENSSSPTQRETINRKFRNARNLVDQWGFKDNIGTPYIEGDWYDERLRTMKTGATLLYGNYPAWTVKEGFENVPLRQIHEDMVTLLFPQKLSFVACRLSLMEDEELFRRQQLCQVGAANDSTTFTSDSLRSHLIMPNVNVPGDCYITWDWATSTARTADFSAGAICRVDENRKVTLTNMEYGRWKPSELAFHIVSTAMQYKPRLILIEKMSGSELLQMEVARVARQCEVALNIWWREPDTTPDAKSRRIRGLQTLLNTDKLWFVSGPWNDELFHQLERYTGERNNRGRKDDLPDALSMIQFFLPSEDAKKKPIQPESEVEYQARIKREREGLRQDYYRAMFKKSVPKPIEEVRGSIPAVDSIVPNVFN